MKLPIKQYDKGVLPRSASFYFPPALSEEEEKIYPYIPWCGHFYCTGKYGMKRNTCPLCLVLYIVAGKMHVEYMGKSFDAITGDVVVLELTTPHHYQAYDGLEFIFVHFSGGNSHEMTRDFIRKHGYLITGSGNNKIKNYLYDTISYYQLNPYESAMETSMRVYKCFSLLYAENQQANNLLENAVDIAQAYMRENIGSPLTLQEIADEVHLNKCYFSHLFKKKTGLSPIEYLTNIRMNQAKFLLMTSNQTINEIAQTVGFANPSSFSNAFANRVGCYPKMFRRLTRQDSGIPASPNLD